ncbi:hypothetical protein LWM68_34360 [Niabella sp. W65]|nr:hypothetical protein [Niabella sp. W65]MCH7367399.1 hypothetical protein [Niabella sp. W65]ULT46687.1 hypothetical protein KRR40_09625 [Niabella sp. I65]
MGALIAGSLATLYVIAKMWAEVFWKEVPADVVVDNKFEPMPLSRKALLITPVAVLGIVSVYIGLNAEVIIQVTDRIATELLDTSSYIEAVFKH